MEHNDGIIYVPYGIQIVIDDVGWWSGRNLSAQNQPYRTGIDRDHYPEDYEAIAYLGKTLGIRPVAAMVLGEWDRNSILKDLPDATWMGRNWKYPGPPIGVLDRTGDIINRNREHMEMAIHAIGHEYWAGGIMERAQWYDVKKEMRDGETIRRHLDFFFELLKTNDLYGDLEFFVPAAFLYAFNRKGGDMASILREYKVKFISTPHRTMKIKTPLEGESFGIEHGILNVDRTVDLVRWDGIDPEISGECTGPVLGMHWPNLLHRDHRRSRETVDRWVKFLRGEEKSPLKMLAASSKEGFSQQVYLEKTGVNVNVENKTVIFDFSLVDGLDLKTLTDFIYFKMPLKVKPIENNRVEKMGDGGGFSLYRLHRRVGEKRTEIRYRLED